MDRGSDGGGLSDEEDRTLRRASANQAGALPEIGELSRDVLDRLVEGCQVVGPDGRYLYLNDSAVTQARKPRCELIGRTMRECYPGIETTPLFARLEQCLRLRQPDGFENEFTFPDGSRGWFEIRLIPVPQGVCILSLDITERRSHLAAIVQDSYDAIVATTLDGVVTTWNKSAERIFGYEAHEIVGRSAELLIPEHRRREESAASARLLRGETISHFRTVRSRRDGSEVDVSVTISPIHDASGALSGFSTIARDITEVERVRRELEHARDAAEAAGRDLESFSYSVAHDLRVPLRSIDGFSQALAEDCYAQLDATGRRRIAQIRSAVRLMSQLIDDILTLSRVSRGELVREQLDLSELARHVLSRLAATDVGRRVEIEVEDGLHGWGDARLVAVVLENLLGNAWKFTSRRPDARIEFGSTRDGGRPVYFVRDNGAGFDMAYANKLFGVFERLHAAHEFEGTGVGLATVRRIVERHGGKVWGEGEVGAGAVFYFTLGEGGPPD
jgi:PAS domain S-box-containing protein